MSTGLIRGKVFKFDDNINTDIIISGKYLRTEDTQIFRKHVFEVLKGEDFYKQIEPGDVIVAGKNFGCGSSREHAALAIKEAGFALILAKSYGRIFLRNIINVGVPAFVLKEEQPLDFFLGQITERDRILVNPEAGKAYIENKGISLAFYPLSEFTKELVKAGGLLNYAKNQNSNCSG